MSASTRTIGGVAGLVVIAVAIVFVGRPDAQPSSGIDTVPLTSVVEDQGAPAGAVGDSQPMADADSDDPVAAAIGFVTGPQRWLFLSPADLDLALAEALADDATALGDRFRAEAGAARDGLRPTAGPVWFVIAPLAHRIESVSETEAVVSVWSVSVLSAADVAASQATWSITTVTMVREDGRWKLRSFDDRPGPTPQPGVTDGPWSPERLADTLDGFTRGRGGASVIVAAGFPDPIGWVVDEAGDLVGGVAGAGFDAVVNGLTGWVVDAAAWVIDSVLGFFLDAADPNLQASWFSGPTGPYVLVAELAAVLMVGFVLAGIAAGALAGDPMGMVRQVAVHVPMSVLGIITLVGVTHTAVLAVDAISRGMFDRFGSDVASFAVAATALSTVVGGSPAGAFVVFLLALVTTVAGVIVLAELVIRTALVYLVVALAPLVFAVRVWPAMAGATRKLLELLVALVVSKLVIAIALVVATAGLSSVIGVGDTATIVAPEAADDGNGSVAQVVGLLLASSAAFGVAAFSPMLVLRLLPVTEAALVASGIRGGPVRTAQTAMALSHHTSGAMHRGRLQQAATGSPGRSGTASSGSTPSSSGPATTGRTVVSAATRPTEGQTRGR